jgi:cytochrome oxidase assembly protein ShyY1
VLEGGYAALVPESVGTDTGQLGLRPLPLPVPSAGPHLAYAIQWFLFIGVAVVGWVALLRATAREAQPNPPAARPDEPVVGSR